MIEWWKKVKEENPWVKSSDTSEKLGKIYFYHSKNIKTK